jgi:hypothetical protein
VGVRLIISTEQGDKSERGIVAVSSLRIIITNSFIVIILSLQCLNTYISLVCGGRVGRAVYHID